MTKTVDCPDFKEPIKAEFDCLIEAVRALHKMALRDSETPCSIEESVQGLTNYESLTEDGLEHLIRIWKQDGAIDLSKPRESLLLRAPSSTPTKIDRDLLIRMTLHGSTMQDFYIGLEFFSKASNRAGWGVVAFHLDPPNQNDAWKFAHVQTAQRGQQHLAEVVVKYMEMHGHRRLPRVPVPAESIVDLMHIAVLAIYGNGQRYQKVVQSMAGRPTFCLHLRSITR